MKKDFEYYLNEAIADPEGFMPDYKQDYLKLADQRAKETIKDKEYQKGGIYHENNIKKTMRDIILKESNYVKPSPISVDAMVDQIYKLFQK